MNLYLRRPVDTWRLVARLGKSLTAPPIDPARENTAVDELAADSLVGRAAWRVTSAIDDSWRTSAVRHAASAVAATLASPDRTDRVRFMGIAISVAALVSLLSRLAQAWPGRFTWTLPAVAAIVGLLMTAMPGPFARALHDRRR